MNDKYTPEQIYDIREVILDVTHKYFTRPDVYMPLKQIIGDYSYDYKLRAIKNVLFKKNMIQGKVLWEFVMPGPNSFFHKSLLDDVAIKVLDEIIRIKKTVYAKNSWKYTDEMNPDLNKGLKKSTEKIKFRFDNVKSDRIVDARVIKRNIFYKKYDEALKLYVPSYVKRMELIDSIIEFGEFCEKRNEISPEKNESFELMMRYLKSI